MDDVFETGRADMNLRPDPTFQASPKLAIEGRKPCVYRDAMP